MAAAMVRNRRFVTYALIFAISTSSSLPSAAAGDLLNKIKGKWHGHKGIASAEALAAEIECLEKHIDWHGSIVAKQPDVWGQARLMKYRQEFEKVLHDEIDEFKPTLQASISRTDQAYLAQALSLSAAISGAPATQLPASQATSQEFFSRRRAALRAGGIANPTPEQLGATQPLPTITPLATNPAAGLVDGFDEDVIQRSEVELAQGIGFAADSAISLEPTVVLDQLARYVSHLHEIRRINEGDDTADSPGYGLHLVRIPVSILPGSHTRKGYGAEITITATPYLGPDLLPTTFRNLVVNDLVEQISAPLATFFNSRTSLESFMKLRGARMKGVEAVSAPNVMETAPVLGIISSTAPASPAVPAPPPMPIGRRETLPAAGSIAPPQTPRMAVRPAPAVPTSVAAQSSAHANIHRTAPVVTTRPTRSQSTTQRDPAIRKTAHLSMDVQGGSAYNRAFSNELRRPAPQAVDPDMTEAFAAPGPEAPVDDAQATLDAQAVRQSLDQAEQALRAATGNTVPAVRARNSRFAFPGTQMAEVYGLELILPVAFEAFDVLLRKPLQNEDAPTVLPQHRVMGNNQDGISAAYDFLSRPEFADLWTNFATPDLARAVQSRDEATIRTIRGAFLASLPNGGLRDDRPYGPRYTTTAAFAWAILVESVLLNERLIKDIRESASAKGGVPLMAEGMPFFLPCPPDEVREVFNEYVRNRFPIHVFALDPVNQEQNLADQLTRTRELQLALSLAFVTGNISAGSMTRYGRRLELQAQTIALNRTQIAFSHGEDTFGWRFQPRYQTPPTQGNLTVAFRDTLLGGPTREQDRRQLELEPGSRECVALVIMPNFVPYVTFETRANWYKLNSPKHSEIDPTKFLVLSSSIKRAYLLAQHICDTNLYRDGDIALLVNRVKQLAAELPMQRMIAQVPYENTHGGFELFNVGVSELAPELLSWYGAPGVSPNNGTSLFFVGDSFSVNQTSVVVGNKLLTGDDVSLLSRQVMRINVPPGTQTVIHGGRLSVEASVATPYGVSQSLYIPVFAGEAPKQAAAPPPAPTFLWSTPTLGLAYKLGNLGIVQPDAANGPTRRPARGLLIGLDSRVDLGNTKADLTLRFGKPDEGVPPVTLTDIPYNSSLGAFEITGAAFDSLVDQLFDDQRFGLLFGKESKPRDVAVGRTIIRLKGVPQAGAGVTTAPGPVIPEDVSNALTIKWFDAP